MDLVRINLYLYICVIDVDVPGVGVTGLFDSGDLWSLNRRPQIKSDDNAGIENFIGYPALFISSYHGPEKMEVSEVMFAIRENSKI